MVLTVYMFAGEGTHYYRRNSAFNMIYIHGVIFFVILTNTGLWLIA